MKIFISCSKIIKNQYKIIKNWHHGKYREFFHLWTIVLRRFWACLRLCFRDVPTLKSLKNYEKICSHYFFLFWGRANVILCSHFKGFQKISNLNGWINSHKNLRCKNFRYFPWCYSTIGVLIAFEHKIKDLVEILIENRIFFRFSHQLWTAVILFKLFRFQSFDMRWKAGVLIRSFLGSLVSLAPIIISKKTIPWRWISSKSRYLNVHHPKAQIEIPAEITFNFPCP